MPLYEYQCRDCAARISPRYPVVELLTACVSAAIVTRFGLTPAARTRLTVAKDDDRDDELARILMQPRPAKPDRSVNLQ